MTSSWFFLSTLNYDARSTTHQIYRKDSSLKCSRISSGAPWLQIGKWKGSCVNTQVSSASGVQNLTVEAVVMCCLVSDVTHQRVVWYGSMGVCWIHKETEKTEQTWKKKNCFSVCSFTINPTQSEATFDCSYTVRRQHLTTQHQDSTIFIWNVHGKTVWTLHWYCIVHWH